MRSRERQIGPVNVRATSATLRGGSVTIWVRCRPDCIGREPSVAAQVE